MLLLIAFGTVFIVQIYFYLFLFRKYAWSNFIKNRNIPKPVSVIVCAKNEESYIKELLNNLAKQEYFSFELVLVDDASTDMTLKEIKTFQQKHQASHFTIQLIQINQQDSQGKKFAITKGIQAAKNEILLLTDADCLPVTNYWIEEMVNGFSENTDVVLGYGGYEKHRYSFLNKLIRFETVLTAIQYFSYAMNGKAYMGVGRNLAYKKSVFIKAGGFDQHSHIKSGDDDLFVSQIAKKDNVAICDHKNAFTISKSHTRFTSWIRQKRRHITTASNYRQETKFLLGLFYMSQIMFYFLLFFAVISKSFYEFILAMAIVRFMFWYAVMAKTTKRLNEKDLIAFGPLYEISIIFIQLYIFIKNIISPPKYW